MKQERYSSPVINKTIDFPQQEVLKVGIKVENILEKREITPKDESILLYLEKYLLFRINVKSGKEGSTKDLYKAEKNLPFNERDEILALNLWARGSRERLDQTSSKDELKALYEKVLKKLKEKPPS